MLHRDPGAPTGWKEIRKLLSPEAAAAHGPLERSLYQIHFVFLSSWCLPNGMMLELKINKRLGKQRKLTAMVHKSGFSALGK